MSNTADAIITAILFIALLPAVLVAFAVGFHLIMLGDSASPDRPRWSCFGGAYGRAHGPGTNTAANGGMQVEAGVGRWRSRCRAAREALRLATACGQVVTRSAVRRHRVADG